MLNVGIVYNCCNWSICTQCSFDNIFIYCPGLVNLCGNVITVCQLFRYSVFCSHRQAKNDNLLIIVQLDGITAGNGFLAGSILIFLFSAPILVASGGVQFYFKGECFVIRFIFFTNDRLFDDQIARLVVLVVDKRGVKGHVFDNRPFYVAEFWIHMPFITRINLFYSKLSSLRQAQNGDGLVMVEYKLILVAYSLLHCADLIIAIEIIEVALQRLVAFHQRYGKGKVLCIVAV